MKQLHIETTGSGRDLVLLHGWAMHGGVWDSVRDTLAKHFRLHVIDLPGHGLSAECLAQNFDEITDYVAAVLPEDCAIAGWSLGGQIAIELALRYPQTVNKLILVASTPCFAQQADWQWGMDARQLQLFTENLKQNYKVTINRFLTLQMTGDQEVTAVLAKLRKNFFQRQEPNPIALQLGLEILHSNDLRSKVAGIKQPVLLIHGENDVITHPKAAQWMTEQITDAQLKLLPHCGHAPFLSYPEQFVSSLYEF